MDTTTRRKCDGRVPRSEQIGHSVRCYPACAQTLKLLPVVIGTLLVVTPVVVVWVGLSLNDRGIFRTIRYKLTYRRPTPPPKTSKPVDLESWKTFLAASPEMRFWRGPRAELNWVNDEVIFDEPSFDATIAFRFEPGVPTIVEMRFEAAPFEHVEICAWSLSDANSVCLHADEYPTPAPTTPQSFTSTNDPVSVRLLDGELKSALAEVAEGTFFEWMKAVRSPPARVRRSTFLVPTPVPAGIPSPNSKRSYLRNIHARLPSTVSRAGKERSARIAARLSVWCDERPPPGPARRVASSDPWCRAVSALKHKNAAQEAPGRLMAELIDANTHALEIAWVLQGVARAASVEGPEAMERLEAAFASEDGVYARSALEFLQYDEGARPELGARVLKGYRMHEHQIHEAAEAGETGPIRWIASRWRDAATQLMQEDRATAGQLALTAADADDGQLSISDANHGTSSDPDG